jgi:hypothetical protein
MSILYLALAIYIAGVAVMLYLRPSIMFHADNGTWKEFGLDNNQRSTVFPFWMFTIVWAFMSYAIATLCHTFVANVVLTSNPMNNEIAAPISELRYTEPHQQVVHTEAPLRAPRAPRVRAPALPASASAPAGPPQLPGYYLMEPQASGVPKFVYFGHEPPTFENLVTHS